MSRVGLLQHSHYHVEDNTSVEGSDCSNPLRMPRRLPIGRRMDSRDLPLELPRCRVGAFPSLPKTQRPVSDNWTSSTEIVPSRSKLLKFDAVPSRIFRVHRWCPEGNIGCPLGTKRILSTPVRIDNSVRALTNLRTGLLSISELPHRWAKCRERSSLMLPILLARFKTG